tara:strand:- start:33039 stop:33602 length:564 start_codon:yes stop_codon:yes gene_type:complete
MTDLNLAYGFLEEPQIDNNNYMNQMQISQLNNMDNNIQNDTKLEVENNNNNIIIEKKTKRKKMNMELDERPLLQRQKDSYQVQNTDNIPEYPYAKKYQPTPNVSQQNNEPIMMENTFWNRFTSKKYDVFKLVIFSLVILFAISLDRIGTYYLSKYINENVLTDRQEFIIRLAYPVLIILILWIFKAL